MTVEYFMLLILGYLRLLKHEPEKCVFIDFAFQNILFCMPSENVQLLFGTSGLSLLYRTWDLLSYVKHLLAVPLWIGNL